jgi:hypothetical protein
MTRRKRFSPGSLESLRYCGLQSAVRSLYPSFPIR